MLVLDTGEIITENVAVLSWIAEQAPELAPVMPLARTRLLEMLVFISTEIHNGFKPLISPNASEIERTNAAESLSGRFKFIADTAIGPYLFGSRFTVADAYLFVTLRWAKQFHITIPDPLVQYFQRVMARDSVRRALVEEGLDNVSQVTPNRRVDSSRLIESAASTG